jgi:hypothetical protein
MSTQPWQNALVLAEDVGQAARMDRRTRLAQPARQSLPTRENLGHQPSLSMQAKVARRSAKRVGGLSLPFPSATVGKPTFISGPDFPQVAEDQCDCAGSNKAFPSKAIPSGRRVVGTAGAVRATPEKVRGVG